MQPHGARSVTGLPGSRLRSPKAGKKVQFTKQCHSQTEEIMVAKNRAVSCESPPSKRTLLRASIASALAAGALACAPATEARVISVQMSAPTLAFGGFSWPGVGQYDKITGVAYAEVDPSDPRNAVIVDINLAQPQATPNVPGVTVGSPGKTAGGKIAYLLNFYILKPHDVNAVDHSLN